MESMDTTYYGAAVVERDEGQFLRKTYFNLLLAIAGFIVLEIFFFMSGLAAVLAPIMASNWLIVLGGFMVLGWLSNYFTSRSVSLSAQYAQMAVTVLLQAFIFLPLLAYAVYFTDASVLSSAVGVTLAIFGGMTAIVAYSGKNFSFLGPFLGVIGIAALITIVGALIFGVSLGFYFAVAMVVFAAGTVLYETSKVIHEYAEGQHVAAATGLFASVALLFYYVLMAFLSRR